MSDYPKRDPRAQRQAGHKVRRVWSFSLHMRDQVNTASGASHPAISVHGSHAKSKADRDALKTIIREAQAMLDARSS